MPEDSATFPLLLFSETLLDVSPQLSEKPIWQVVVEEKWGLQVLTAGKTS
jgi:hypothetical protein